MTNEFDYPAKIKGLVEELRYSKEKIKEIEDKLRKEEKQSILTQDSMVKLEESCRELKTKLKAKQKNDSSNHSMMEGHQNENADASMNLGGETVDELKRANKILIRAKEVMYRRSQYLKSKFEKKTDRFKAKIETLTN